MPALTRETLLSRYHYDPLDRLVDCAPAALADVRRFYCQSRLVTEVQGTVYTSVFQHDEQLLAQQQRQGVQGDTTLLATDRQRSILNALDAAQPHHFAYTPYGHRPAENGLLSLLGFNGERPDPVTGHYHLGNGYRQFNPVLMRFNNPDSWSPFGEGGVNAYAYCAGDPVNMRDPTGHIPVFLKPFLRKLKLMKPSSTDLIDQRLAEAQDNTFKNIHSLSRADKTLKNAYLEQINLEKHRQPHAAMLSSNPEFTSRRTPTLTRLETGETVPARQQYAYLVLDHASKTPTSPLLERASKVVISNTPPTTHEVERFVPTPVGGWTKAADIRMPKQPTLWSRRGRPANTQQTS